jgi:4-carboxymuconolactone decarboxylase
MNARLEKGKEILNKLDENNTERIKNLLSDISEDFSNFLIESFGDVFTRPHLDLKTRELLTIASLTTLGYAGDRLKTHFKGALNIGVSKDEIIETIIQMIPYVGFPATVNALLILKEVFHEQGIL